MTKKKKIVIASIIGALVILIGLGAFFGIRYIKDVRDLGIKDTLPMGNGKKASVILLSGQSNASGCSSDEYLEITSTAEKFAEYKAGYDNVYINYQSGLNASNEFVKCSISQGEMGGYFGPELGLAEKLHEQRPDDTFFIIKCAFGGTNLFEQWLSPSSKGKTGSLYKQMIDFVDRNLRYLEKKGYDVEIVGMCWMQGESDSFDTENASNYGKNLSNFIKDVRKKFSRHAAEDGIVFVDAYIAANPSYWVFYEMVNAGKDEVYSESDINRLIDTNGEGLTTATEPFDTPDLAHYDSQSEIKLGHLFAEELLPYLD